MKILIIINVLFKKVFIVFQLRQSFLTDKWMKTEHLKLQNFQNYPRVMQTKTIISYLDGPKDGPLVVWECVVVGHALVVHRSLLVLFFLVGGAVSGNLHIAGDIDFGRGIIPLKKGDNHKMKLKMGYFFCLIFCSTKCSSIYEWERMPHYYS